MLILTSSGKFITTHDVDRFLPKKIANCKIAYIITASKKVNSIEYLEKHRNAMDELHRNYTEMDIADRTEIELRKMLVGYDIVLVEGGNTFYLLKAVRESGFDKIIRNLIAQGVVYVGSSAGSYIACPSIIIASWSDAKKYDRCGITDYTAMNLVPFLIHAHYVPEEQALLQQRTKGLPFPLRVLTDNQALVVDNSNVQLIGEGDEAIL